MSNFLGYIIIIMLAILIIAVIILVKLKRDNSILSASQNRMSDDETNTQLLSENQFKYEKTEVLNEDESFKEEDVSKYKDDEKTELLKRKPTDTFAPLNIGDILNDKYRIEDIIGSGAQGSVYVCTNMELGNQWAVKHFNGSMNERDILVRLNHSSLPKIADVFEDESGSYIIENYIEGQSLDSLIKERDVFYENEVIGWMIQLCEALYYLHSKNILHMDIKPKNILITHDNRAMLIDFGIASFLNQENDGHYDIYGYSPMFSSPEQEGGRGVVDQRSDIYSLGATMFYLLTKVSAKADVKLKSRYPQLSDGFARLIHKCIHKSKDKRYTTSSLLKKELVQIQEKNIKDKKAKGIERNEVVALVGTEKKVGTTHTVLLFAYTLKKMKKRVAVVQNNTSETFSQIQQVHKGASNSLQFTLKGVDFFLLEEDIYDKIEHYDYIIVDMGVNKQKSSKTLFNMASKKLVVCDANIYNQHRMLDFCKSEADAYAEYTYILPLASDKEASEFRRYLGTKKAYQIPYDKEIFNPDNMTQNIIKKIS